MEPLASAPALALLLLLLLCLIISPKPPLCMFFSHAQALGGPGWLWVAVDGIAVPASCSQLVLTVFLGNPSSFKCKLPPQVLQVFIILQNLQVYSVSVELGQTKTLFFFFKKKKRP